MSWNDERTALLEKMWTEGKSAAEIAKELGDGVTRNAVIGKAHRMGLSGRPSPIKKTKPATAEKKPAAKAKAKATPAKEKTPLVSKTIMPIPAAPRRERKQTPKGKGLSILDLTDRICKWPLGDPQEEDFHFCGDAVHPGRPYCVDHCTEAYQALQRKAQAAKKAKLAAEAEADKDDDDLDLEGLEDVDDAEVDEEKIGAVSD